MQKQVGNEEPEHCLCSSYFEIAAIRFHSLERVVLRKFCSLKHHFWPHSEQLSCPLAPHLSSCHIRFCFTYFIPWKGFAEGIQVQAARLHGWCITDLSVGCLEDLADYGVKSHCDRSLTPAALCKPLVFHLVHWSLPSSLSHVCLLRCLRPHPLFFIRHHFSPSTTFPSTPALFFSHLPPTSPF